MTQKTLICRFVRRMLIYTNLTTDAPLPNGAPSTWFTDIDGSTRVSAARLVVQAARESHLCAQIDRLKQLVSKRYAALGVKLEIKRVLFAGSQLPGLLHG